MDNIKATIENFYDEVKALVGNVEMRICHSETNFGQSSYLYVGPFKVRYSDHSTGVHRIISEMNLSSLTKKSILEAIERHYFPERYEKIESMEWGGEQEATENKINGLTFEYRIIRKDVRVSKKGQSISVIQVKNVPTTTFVKIS